MVSPVRWVPPIASGMGRQNQTEIFKDCSHKASSCEVQRGSFCPCIIVDKENGIDSVAREVLGRNKRGTEREFTRRLGTTAADKP